MHDVAVMEGVVWLATDAGARSLGADGTWSTVTVADGLPHDTVRVLEVADQRLCFGTDAGAACLIPATGAWTRLPVPAP